MQRNDGSNPGAIAAMTGLRVGEVVAWRYKTDIVLSIVTLFILDVVTCRAEDARTGVSIRFVASPALIFFTSEKVGSMLKPEKCPSYAGKNVVIYISIYITPCRPRRRKIILLTINASEYINARVEGRLSSSWLCRGLRRGGQQ
jgi:hypothetical protein